jgi:hypothetical protein
MIGDYIYNILFSSHLYFIEGQRGACAYISPSYQMAANFPSHVAERNTKCLLRALTLYQR